MIQLDFSLHSVYRTKHLMNTKVFIDQNDENSNSTNILKQTSYFLMNLSKMIIYHLPNLKSSMLPYKRHVNFHVYYIYIKQQNCCE